MCVAVPGKILSIDADRQAVADFGGVNREVSLALLEDAVVGDYVIVHAGFAMHKVDGEEAQETIRLFQKYLDENPD